MGVDEQGSCYWVGEEVGELKEEPARPRWESKFGRFYSRSWPSTSGVRCIVLPDSVRDHHAA